MTSKNGKLYIVATPIGNLSDITYRAVKVLQGVDLIAAEDTRHSRRLLDHYNIRVPMTLLHEHNEDRAIAAIIKRLAEGESIALISDAGTPLISDPGFPLVRAAHQMEIPTLPIPGPCALISALSVSGLATDRFCFEGFPPRTRAARKAFFEKTLDYSGTLIFYESGHRIMDCISDLHEIFPGQRNIVLARELTKIHETLIRAKLADVYQLLENRSEVQKGELVLLVEGARPINRGNTMTRKQENTLRLILQHCSLKDAVAITAELTDQSKKLLYQEALKIKEALKTK